VTSSKGEEEWEVEQDPGQTDLCRRKRLQCLGADGSGLLSAHGPVWVNKEILAGPLMIWFRILEREGTPYTTPWVQHRPSPSKKDFRCNHGGGGTLTVQEHPHLLPGRPLWNPRTTIYLASLLRTQEDTLGQSLVIQRRRATRLTGPCPP